VPKLNVRSTINCKWFSVCKFRDERLGHLGLHRNLIPFKSGQSGNPRGRPKGARSKLGEDFLTEPYENFAVHGAAAIERVCEDDPAACLRVIVSVLPKDKDRPQA
jgi:Family of unknown function (DUF5681)